MTVDNAPLSGSIFDFALYFFHNAKELVARGSGPYFYLPKMEHYKEARLWNDIFNFSQSYLGLPHGTIRGTVLIETLPAAFQMEEILFELREHSSGLNCGRYASLSPLTLTVLILAADGTTSSASSRGVVPIALLSSPTARTSP